MDKACSWNANVPLKCPTIKYIAITSYRCARKSASVSLFQYFFRSAYEKLSPVSYTFESFSDPFVTFQVLLLSYTPPIEKSQTISNIQHNNAQRSFWQTSSENEFFVMQNGKKRISGILKRSIISQFSYRHSPVSILTGTKSMLKEHNIWLKHCRTTR